MDRAHNGPVLVASTQGGMDIEEVRVRGVARVVVVCVCGRVFLVLLCVWMMYLRAIATLTPPPTPPPSALLVAPPQVAEKHPDAIIKESVDISTGTLSDAQAERLAGKLGLSGDLARKAAAQFKGLYTMFLATDATQVEINPLAEGSVPGGQTGLIFAVDAKLNFDDNAAFRQKVGAARA
jgi:succinyl-CoA synthetase beta subunit